ncbi:MAG TPA: N-acetylmuramoyl-L-alanine amidase [Acidimicrobiales bacterium]|nr:N-acetylmuramoyl-L-alanine amidase [Acidimicrobiales bacterium]
MTPRWVRTLVVVALMFLPAARSAEATGAGAPRAVQLTAPLSGSDVRRLPFAADHVALYWTGHANAVVRLAFSRDGARFGRFVDAGRDEPGPDRTHGVTYGAIRRSGGATFLRITSTQRLGQLTVLALADHPVRRLLAGLVEPQPVAPHAPRPTIIARSDWGANESLRFTNGSERWPPKFAPVQKLIVHHTDTGNHDPNPASTVRAIYHYHAVTREWGDIGYNFLIDESGRIYKGRNSHAPGSDTDTITGQNAAGEGVTGAHAQSYNAGSVGVAMLGTLTDQDATPAARNALADLLAWEADGHDIDPHGASQYTNPSAGNQKTFANIAGHRDVGQTQCPGGSFYAALPALRDAVASRMR